jgi:hypothetical protein
MTEDPTPPAPGGEGLGDSTRPDDADTVRDDADTIQEDTPMDEVDMEMSPEPNEEQLLYAKILERGMFLGLAILLVTFALYASGLISPGVPIERLPDYWVLSVHEYLEAIEHNHLHQDHLITGWAWLSLLSKGDFLNFLPIAILSGVTIVCYMGIVPTLLKKKDFTYAVIAVVEVLILTLAASGLLTVGH